MMCVGIGFVSFFVASGNFLFCLIAITIKMHLVLFILTVTFTSYENKLFCLIAITTHQIGYKSNSMSDEIYGSLLAFTLILFLVFTY